MSRNASPSRVLVHSQSPAKPRRGATSPLIGSLVSSQNATTIGLVLNSDGIITNILEGSPADIFGELLVGDVIVDVDGEAVEGQQVYRKMKEKKGGKFTVTVKRGGDKLKATLVRVRRWTEAALDLPGLKELQVASFNGKEDVVKNATKTLVTLAETLQQRDLWRNEALSARIKARSLSQRIQEQEMTSLALGGSGEWESDGVTQMLRAQIRQLQEQRDSLELQLSESKAQIRKEKRDSAKAEVERYRLQFEEHTLKLETCISKLQADLRLKTQECESLRHMVTLGEAELSQMRNDVEGAGSGEREERGEEGGGGDDTTESTVPQSPATVSSRGSRERERVRDMGGERVGEMQAFVTNIIKILASTGHGGNSISFSTGTDVSQPHDLPFLSEKEILELVTLVEKLKLSVRDKSLKIEELESQVAANSNTIFSLKMDLALLKAEGGNQTRNISSASTHKKETERGEVKTGIQVPPRGPSPNPPPQTDNETGGDLHESATQLQREKILLEGMVEEERRLRVSLSHEYHISLLKLQEGQRERDATQMAEIKRQLASLHTLIIGTSETARKDPPAVSVTPSRGRRGTTNIIGQIQYTPTKQSYTRHSVSPSPSRHTQQPQTFPSSSRHFAPPPSPSPSSTPSPLFPKNAHANQRNPED